MPTQKQKLAFQKALENPSESLHKILRAAGYSQAVAVQPKEVTESKGWKELMAKHLPDKKLARLEAKQLQACTICKQSFNLNISDEEIGKIISGAGCALKKIVTEDKQKIVIFLAPDNATISKALDRIHKLKGNFAPGQGDNSTVINMLNIENGLKSIATNADSPVASAEEILRRSKADSENTVQE